MSITIVIAFSSALHISFLSAKFLMLCLREIDVACHLLKMSQCIKMHFFACCIMFIGASVEDFITLYKKVLVGEGSLLKRLKHQIKPPYDRSNFAKYALIAEIAIADPSCFKDLKIQVWIGCQG